MKVETQEKDNNCDEIFNLLPQIICEIDNKGIFTYVNKIGFEKFGYTPEDLNRGMKVFDVLVAEDHDRAMKNILRVLNREKLNGIEYTGLRKNGTTFPILVYTGLIIRENKPIGLRAIVIDNTERKNTEQKLRESEERYRLITENADDVVWTTDMNLNLTYISPSCPKILGYTIEEAKNRPINKTVAPSSLKKIVNIFKEEMKLERKKDKDLTRSRTFETEQIHKNGSIIDVEMTITFMRDENGNAIGLLGVSRDISNRKKVEKALKESEAKYRHLYEESPNSITLVNRKGKILDTNPATEKIYGYTRDEIIGKNYFDLGIYCRDQNSLFEKRYKDALEGKKLKPIEIQIKRKDGSLAWINYQSSIIKKDDDIFIEALAQDITQRKIAYEALKAVKEFTDNILNTSIDTIFVFEPQTGRAIKWNKAFSDITGYTDDEIASLKAPDSYYSEEDLKCAAKAIEKVLSEGKTTVEMSLITKDGRRIPFEYTARTFKSVDGDLLIVSVGRDITKRKKIERDLRESENRYHHAYDRANFYKELIAHDMNNLLQTIQSSVELYTMFQNKPEYLKDRRNLLNIITKQVFRGAAIVSNIIKLSELEETEIMTEPIEVINILEEAIKFVYKSFQGRKIKIEVDTQSKKFFVKANDLLLDLFENILINGVKHNTNPEIEIIVKISEEQKNPINYVKFEFIDNGIGIPDEKKESLFQRVHKRNGKERGLGIGLSLVKQLIDIYNGKIWIENRIKGDYTKGSNFIVLIPKAI